MILYPVRYLYTFQFLFLSTVPKDCPGFFFALMNDHCERITNLIAPISNAIVFRSLLLFCYLNFVKNSGIKNMMIIQKPVSYDDMIIKKQIVSE